MDNVRLLTTALTHQLYARALDLGGRRSPSDLADSCDARDRGAVSLEQVLWFVAAGVSVAVIAGVLWSQIKDKADDPISPPAAP